MYNAQVKSIQEINTLKQETTCVTVGTTGKFIVSKNGWSYPGCSTCTKRATTVDGPFTCQKGHYNEGSVPMYKLEIRVYHKRHNAKFLFWDYDSETIGKSALELLNKMIEVCIHNLAKMSSKLKYQVINFSLPWTRKAYSCSHEENIDKKET